MALRGFAAVGECMIELSDEQAERWRMGFAGDSLNTAWYVGALLPEMPVDFVSAFGDDPFSQRQMAFLAQAGIGIAASPVRAGARPGLYAITLDGAERSFSYWRADSAARALASDEGALRQSLEGRAMVYLTGITLAILAPDDRATLLRVVADLRKGGTRIAFDPNHRPRLWRDAETAKAAYTAMLELCDIALPTWEDEEALFGDAIPEATARRLHGLGVGEVVVKRGAQPALISTARGQVEIEALPAHAVDTTGAGDSFCGGYLAARLAGLGEVEAARIGHQVAARVIGVYGALMPKSTMADLRPVCAMV